MFDQFIRQQVKTQGTTICASRLRLVATIGDSDAIRRILVKRGLVPSPDPTGPAPPQPAVGSQTPAGTGHPGRPGSVHNDARNDVT
jgi:hypothetical protein